MKTSYQSFSDRIKKSSSKEDLKKLELSLDSLLVNGVFTISEYQKLDAKLMEKMK